MRVPTRQPLVRLLLVAGLAGLTFTATAQQYRLLQDDFPFQKSSVGTRMKGDQTTDKASKGVAIHVGNDATMSFDEDLLRWQGAWVGGFISSRGVTFDGSHGGHPEIVGTQKLGTPMLPAWAGKDGEFKDTRSPEPFGPMDKELARFDGIYVVGDKVVVAATVRGTKVYDQPGSEMADGEVVFTRTLKIVPPKGWFSSSTKETVSTLLAEVSGANGTSDGKTATLNGPGDAVTVAALSEAPAGVTVETTGGRLVLKISKGTKGATFRVSLWSGAKAKQGVVATVAAKPVGMVDPMKPEANRWPEAITLTGKLSSSETPDGAFVTDSIPVPMDNPWKRRVRTGGFDFFADGRSAALSTWDGDVWIVTGIDADLKSLKWTRYASGLFEPLGLKIVDGLVYVSGRNGITRLHDLNKDGQADFYENFNNDITASWGFHEFVFDLQTDKAGNFYFSKAAPVKGGGRGFGGGGGNGEVTSSAGKLLKVSKDGKKFEIVASGLRAPNGIGVNPWNGQLTTGDNEGTWVPACPLNWIKPGGFNGVEETGGMKPYAERDLPAMWFQFSKWDNSGGAQVWVSPENWGLPKGELIHLSYGQCAIYHVMPETVNGKVQAGAVRIPVKFSSSAMRARFNPLDGQLYVVGLRGWQTTAPSDSGFERVRYTGKPRYSVDDIATTKDGVKFRFTQPLDAKEAADVENFAVERWNYANKFTDDKSVGGHIKHSGTGNKLNYGGWDVSVEDPTKIGHDKVDVARTELSADGKTLTLHFADWKPAQQVLTKFLLKAKDGKLIEQEVLQTIHTLPN
jgi:hypothetical protein